MSSAIDPTPITDGQGDGRWMSQHNRYIHEAKEKEPDIVLIGDSLIRKLALTQMWIKMFVPLHALNFGIGGDRTQHVLWRVLNGEMDNVTPKVIVLLVGTNNHENTDGEVVEGIMEIAKQIHSRQQQAQIIVMLISRLWTKIVLKMKMVVNMSIKGSLKVQVKTTYRTMGIPPRGQYPTKVRDKVASINKYLSHQVSNIPNTTFLATDPELFVNKDGEISHMDMYDYLHLSEQGYEKLCKPLLECIHAKLKDFKSK